MGVENVTFGVRQRLPQRNQVVRILLAFPERYCHGRFRRAVEIVQFSIELRREPSLQFVGQCFAATDDASQALTLFDSLFLQEDTDALLGIWWLQVECR